MNSNLHRTFSRILFVALFIFLLSSSEPLKAQNAGNFAKKGVIELGGSISYQNITSVYNGSSGSSTGIFMFQPYFGYFPVDGFEIGINPLGITVLSNITVYNIFLAPSYNFKETGILFPFIEGQIGYTAQDYSGSSLSGLSWGLRAGFKIAVTSKGLLNIGIQYQQITLDPSNTNTYYGSSNGRNGTNELSIAAGFSVWLN